MAKYTSIFLCSFPLVNIPLFHLALGGGPFTKKQLVQVFTSEVRKLRSNLQAIVQENSMHRNKQLENSKVSHPLHSLPCPLYSPLVVPSRAFPSVSPLLLLSYSLSHSSLYNVI